MYNFQVADHFYITDYSEVTTAQQNNYVYEGVAWTILDTQVPRSQPLIRYWSLTAQDHFTYRTAVRYLEACKTIITNMKKSLATAFPSQALTLSLCIGTITSRMLTISTQLMEMSLAQVEVVDMLMKLWLAMSDGWFFLGHKSWIWLFATKQLVGSTFVL